MADALRNTQPHPTFALGLLPTNLLGALPVKFEDPCVGGGAAASLEPVEQLGGRIDLVVVFAAREDRQLV
jgi:hypothetical protein